MQFRWTLQKSPYEILGIYPLARADEIRSAYRYKAMIHHPDRGGNIERFKEVQMAHDFLSDPKCKEEYDRMVSVNNGNLNEVGRALDLREEYQKAMKEYEDAQKEAYDVMLRQQLALANLMRITELLGMREAAGRRRRSTKEKLLDRIKSRTK